MAYLHLKSGSQLIRGVRRLQPRGARLNHRLAVSLLAVCIGQQPAGGEDVVTIPDDRASTVVAVLPVPRHQPRTIKLAKGERQAVAAVLGQLLDDAPERSLCLRVHDHRGGGVPHRSLLAALHRSYRPRVYVDGTCPAEASTRRVSVAIETAQPHAMEIVVYTSSGFYQSFKADRHGKQWTARTSGAGWICTF